MKKSNVNAADLAKFIGIKEQEVNDLVERGVFPRLPDGKFGMAGRLLPYLEKYNYDQDLKQMRDLAAECLVRSAEGGDAGHIRVLHTILGMLNTEISGGSTRPEKRTAN